MCGGGGLPSDSIDQELAFSEDVASESYIPSLLARTGLEVVRFDLQPKLSNTYCQLRC